jgi:hypothetical protein
MQRKEEDNEEDQAEKHRLLTSSRLLCFFLVSATGEEKLIVLLAAMCGTPGDSGRGKWCRPLLGTGMRDMNGGQAAEISQMRAKQDTERREEGPCSL